MSRLRNFVALLPLSLLGAPVFAADAAAGPTPEAATQAPEDKSGELTEVVITAEKRESTVQQTAISMSALSAEALQNQGISSIEELAGAVPGVSMRTAGPGQTEYEMRGLTSAGGSTATGAATGGIAGASGGRADAVGVRVRRDGVGRGAGAGGVSTGAATGAAGTGALGAGSGASGAAPLASATFFRMP